MIFNPLTLGTLYLYVINFARSLLIKLDATHQFLLRGGRKTHHSLMTSPYTRYNAITFNRSSHFLRKRVLLLSKSEVKRAHID